MFRFISITLLCGLINACSVGPDYVKPSVQIPVSYKEQNKQTTNKNWKIAEPQDDCQRGLWWQVFNDPELNILESKLNISNQNIVAAKANYAQARALVDEARASYFPTISASAILIRQNRASTSGNISTQTSPTTSHSLSLDASWEPDIWGATRRSVEASETSAQASAALLAVTRLSAQASLAQFYFELRALDTDQKLLDQNVVDNQKLLQLTKNRYLSGVVSLSDIIQAESQLETAQTEAINNGIARAQFEHAIAVLIGQPPEMFSLPPSPLGVIQPPEIPVEIPSALLERRPDIAEAERLVAAANAKIGVAVSAYYPTLNLSATGSLQNQGLSNWFSLPSLVWSVGSTLAETLFDGGLRTAVTKAARANYCATVANYRQTVLSAFQDVEDNMAALRILNSEYKVQNEAAANARLALKLITNQYKAGIVAYSSVITAQIAAFTAEKTAADLNGLRMTASVGLIKALGGGWEGADT